MASHTGRFVSLQLMKIKNIHHQRSVAETQLQNIHETIQRRYYSANATKSANFGEFRKRDLKVFFTKRSFASKSQAADVSNIDPETGKTIVESDVVVDDDDRHLVHRARPIVETKKELTEEDYMKLQDKSGLQPAHRRMLHQEVPYESPVFWTHRTTKYQRRMYAKYGEASGVNPGIQWPLQDELLVRLEYESIARPFTLHEMVQTIEDRKQAEQEVIDKRAIEIETNMEKSEKNKQEYHAKIAVKEKESQVAQDRRDKLMEEVRRHFGFKIDPRDERFQEMLEKKEKEQRKVMKEARRVARQEKELASLTKKEK